MAENFRSGVVWRAMMSTIEANRGMHAAKLRTITHSD
jgi:hypothetical protein